MVRIKICGITSLEDALTAVDAGADALGFVFYAASPRNITPEHAADIIHLLPPFIQTVGLFVNETADNVNALADRCGLDVVQLHGEETPEYCGSIRRRVIKAFRIKDLRDLDALPSFNVSGYLLDAWSPVAHGGTGQTFSWEIAAEAVTRGYRIILAGGLSPDNVAECIRKATPYGVDVSSGVEMSPGRKDAHKLRSFIQEARCLDVE
jgi:phosphoribosylanthranilate isomerase